MEKDNAIQRTIEDESAIQVIGVPANESQSNTSIIYGMGAVLLIIVAIGAAVMLWKVKSPTSDQNKI